MRTLEDRVAELEKGLIVWKRVAIVSGAALLAVIAVAATGPAHEVAEVVKTHKLEVIDAEGHVLTSIFDTGGVGRFIMNDKDDHPHISMMAEPTGAVIDFAGTEKHIGITTQTNVADKAMITITEWKAAQGDKTDKAKTLWQAP